MHFTIRRDPTGNTPTMNRIVLVNDYGDVVKLICGDKLCADILTVALEANLADFTTTQAETN